MPLNSEYIAPSGQIYLQNGLYIIIDNNIVIIRRKFFHAYKNPMVLRKDLFNNTNGIPPSSVPTGQINLQKYGEPCPMTSTKNKGIKMTNTTSIKYFIFLRNLSPLNVFIFFTKGILLSRSCINPKGQSQPQTKRPISAPMKIKKPAT